MLKVSAVVQSQSQSRPDYVEWSRSQNLEPEPKFKGGSSSGSMSKKGKKWKILEMHFYTWSRLLRQSPEPEPTENGLALQHWVSVTYVRVYSRYTTVCKYKLYRRRNILQTLVKMTKTEALQRVLECLLGCRENINKFTGREGGLWPTLHCSHRPLLTEPG